VGVFFSEHSVERTDVDIRCK